jgi:DNA-binding response OmpR family regulator
MHKTILLVENERPLLNVLRFKLERENYKVLAVSNGLDAKDLIEQNEIDLVILDLIIPGMGGFDLLQDLSENKEACKVLVLSNLSQEEDIQKAKKLGAQDYLIKPKTSLKQVLNSVNKTLDNENKG